jgi:phosphoribosylformylglycinamidine (FGAM) synthase-like amidotransferase family enzyme
LRKTSRERGSLGRAKSAFGHAYGGREGDANPNGSANDISRIYSKDLNVLGLMSHPENLVDPLVGGTEGSGLFESLAAFCEQNAQILAG